TVDHIVMIGLNSAPPTATSRQPTSLNGKTAPEPILIRAGVPNRLRVINITPNNVGLTVSLVNSFEPVQWKIVAKDGADVAEDQRTLRLARQLVTVGEA